MLAEAEEAVRVSEAKLAENDVMSVNCNVFMYMYVYIMCLCTCMYILCVQD